MATPTPGFVVLQGNRLEDLATLALDWLGRHPLPPLQAEQWVVPSSGMAEWLKAAIAEQHGVAAGFRMELPAQFAWRCVRAVLGPDAVPARSPLDKQPLAWRLMRLLPRWAPEPGFEPLAAFLAAEPPGGAALRRWALARRLADLFDQYQVYRPDWLHDWARGQDRLRGAAEAGNPAATRPVPAGQRWQCALWRVLLHDLHGPEGVGSGAASGVGSGAGSGAVSAPSRPALLAQAVARLQAAAPGTRWAGLPPRLLLFGTTQLPHATLELLGALSRHCAVLLAVPNPSPHPWAHLARQDIHPLLAAWGRQCGDFLRQLEAFDEGLAAQQRLALPRIALFDDAPGHTLLTQLQASLRDQAVPFEDDTAAPPPAAPAASDRSLVFHVSHGPLREVEALHDELLRRLGESAAQAKAHAEAVPAEATLAEATRPTIALAPRDIVVMVPDIDRFAPAIAAVFGRHAPGDARHIPWGLADRRERGRQPLLLALEALLRVREQRFTLSELLGLLGTPALRARLGLAAADLPQLQAWLVAGGARWGLHAAQRSALGLGAAGDTGSLRFAIDRLLMGHATGSLALGVAPLAGIEPEPEALGLEAASLGRLAQWAQQLQDWWREAETPRPPAAWRAPLQQLLADSFSPTDDRERSLLAQADAALQRWLADCASAGFEEPLPLALVREAWLDGLDEAGGGGRFRAGGVTFCTLMPLRAIPFRVVALLGMNDGDYPRAAPQSDFDLLTDPALARAGDRSRRDDDRQLMLDALLAARDALILSWSGFSPRDGQVQPPSLLVAQLMEQLRGRFGDDAVRLRTTVHPLQPFARAYFEAAPGRPLSYAHEWRRLHEAGPGGVERATSVAPRPADPATDPTAPPRALKISQLAEFLIHPVRAFFVQRLRADLRLFDDALSDDEPFAGGGLEGWSWADALLAALQGFDPAGDEDPAEGEEAREAALAASSPPSDSPESPEAATAPWLARARAVAERLQRQGRLPWGGPGEHHREALLQSMAPLLQAWQSALARQAGRPNLAALTLEVSGIAIDTGPLPRWPSPPCFVRASASRLLHGDKAQPGLSDLRASQLVPDWLAQLALAAADQPAALLRLAPDAVVEADAIAPQAARALLAELVQAWREGASAQATAPWPTAVATGLAALASPDSPERARAIFEADHAGAESREPHMARLYPDFEALCADGRFARASIRLYAPLAQWLQGLRLKTLSPGSEADAPSVDAAAADAPAPSETRHEP